MKYRSTRDDKIEASFCEAVAGALSPDGGLFYPEKFPEFRSEEPDYGTLSGEVLSLFASEVDKSKLQAVCKDNYQDFPIPLVQTKAGNFLELFHGPSGAFKDIALTMLPKLSALCDPVDTTYVVATSGDTGKAALEAFKDLPGTSILVFYPADGVAKLQELQMQTQKGDNVSVIAIEGNFDDAQRAAKEILLAGHKGVSSCNSINIARLVSQVPYYFHAMNQLQSESISFIVPSGNFGDILAGYYAKQMGLPVEKLVVATNENSVLRDFFTTGVYDRKRELYKTSSPSMDILVSSNLERLLCHLFGAEETKALMQKLDADGRYEVPVEKLEGFEAYSASEEEVQAAIRTVYEEAGYVMDPHTACGWVAWDKMGRPADTVILSTASPSKFPETIVKALRNEDADPKEALEILSTYTPLHAALSGLYELPVRFTKRIPREDAVQAFEEFQRGRK